MKRRRFFRRRSRRPRADVLNFSICGSTISINKSQDTQDAATIGTCANPFIDVQPLILGGQAGYSGGEGSTALVNVLYAADQAERGATIGGFKFKYFVNTAGYVNQAGPDNTVGVTHVFYSAICKLQYDNDVYRSIGVPQIHVLPNIVGARIPTIASGLTEPQPLGDVNADVLWRDICYVADRPLDSTLFSSTPIQEWQDFQYLNKSRTPPWNYVRVKRRLKEDEGLFWVTNVVSGLPQFNEEAESAYVAAPNIFVYGVAAAKLR